MTTQALEIRDAGPLDIDDDLIAFEDELDAELAPAACLPRPYPTWVPSHSPRGADD
ncbi:SflA family class IV lanthipeptide [Kitasatospora sp. RB6PN24]|uniref:SflA family class IV lanthipeptide n=1 Tax=Kitasatospora humi TaxID=2893891 RepID=UPI001E30162A|nr:SflA family class IV lanthipeptide [Kitasatospora humi]MCC9308281.1 SflA family class IV lanthipeptide [Kitasatospora humi]